MLITRNNIGLLMMILFLGNRLLAYEHLPELINFNKQDYNAGRQNWGVDIDEHGVVFFANTNGLLYNVYGEWALSKLPGNGVLRSVLTKNDTIWCGGDEYGYFVKENGKLNYHSIGNSIDDNVWNIETQGANVYFQTKNEVFIYNTANKKLSTITHYEGIWSLVKWNNKIWVFLKNGQIGYIDNDKISSVTSYEKLKSKEVRSLFVHNGNIYIVTFEGGVYTFNGEQLSEVKIQGKYNKDALFCGASYNEDAFALGTISNGLLLINNQGELIKKVNASHGLIDNTVLSINTDLMGNIWLGLDYGICEVKAESAINIIFKGAATYHAIDFKGITYLATNKGVFKYIHEKGFELIEKTGGQVWKLRVIDDELYICHNRGLFKLVNEVPVNVFDYGGVLDVAKFKGTDYSLISTYDGLVFVKKKRSGYEYIYNVEHWGTSKMVFSEKHQAIFCEIPGKMVYKCTLKQDNNIDLSEFYGVVRLYETNIGAYFGNQNNIFEYVDGEFSSSNNPLVAKIKNEDISEFAISNDGKSIAYISSGSVKFEVLLPDGNTYAYNPLLKSVSVNLNKETDFLDIRDGVLWIATDRGVTLFNTEFHSKTKTTSSPVISSVNVLNNNNQKILFPFPESGLKFSTGNKDLKFKFNLNKPHHDVVEYRYYLYPKQKDWSEWHADINEVFYSQVKGGKYTFYLQSRINEGLIDKTELNLSIEKLWYQTWLVTLPIALIVIVWIFGVILVMSRINKRKLSKQKKQYVQENAKRTLEMKNEQLLQYTEIISHKNEFLNKLKSGLESMRNAEAKRWMNMITEEVNSEKKDFLFHKLFSEIHQDFISRLTEKYPQLTSNDVRILSFIRINLDNKEISNLMNITQRSLDTNRYRLRKKLELEQNVELNQFIRDF